MPDSIQAILFDANGVIVNPMLQFSRYLAQVHGITPEQTRPYYDPSLHHPPFSSIITPYLERKIP